MSTREKFINKMDSWVGKKESDGSYVNILKSYNSIEPLPRKYKLKLSDEWCAATVSAASYECNLLDVVFPECSCIEMQKYYRSRGRIVDKSAIPSPGDIIFYKWKNGNRHVGIVKSCDGKTITTIEGNKDEAVGRRIIPVGWQYIECYASPDYESKDIKPVPSEWDNEKKAAIEWAVSKGLVKGDGTGINWTEPVTLERFITILYRFFQMI